MMPAYLFYLFAAVTILGGLGVVIRPNPVASAIAMIACFVGVAALFVSLNAYFIATIQVLVYAGAIMVLFLFIIMLLDLKTEERRRLPVAAAITAALVAGAFGACLGLVVNRTGAKGMAMPELAAGPVQDVNAIGQVIYSEYTFPLQVVAVILLVATIGVVVLSKRQLN